MGGAQSVGSYEDFVSGLSDSERALFRNGEEMIKNGERSDYAGTFSDEDRLNELGRQAGVALGPTRRLFDAHEVQNVQAIDFTLGEVIYAMMARVKRVKIFQCTPTIYQSNACVEAKRVLEIAYRYLPLLRNYDLERLEIVFGESIDVPFSLLGDSPYYQGLIANIASNAVVIHRPTTGIHVHVDRQRYQTVVTVTSTRLHSRK